MPLRMIPEDRREMLAEQRRRREAEEKRGARRKQAGPKGTARKPSPSAGPGSAIGQQGGKPIKPKKPKILISLANYDKARKEVEAEGGSPRLKTESDRVGRTLNKVYGTVRNKSLAEQPYGAFLSGGQAKLDKNKNNKIDAQDFKILRAEKAKGRGQGLQDEKMKPGKVMKANKGRLFTAEQKKKFPGLGKAKSVEEYIKRKKEVSGKGKMTFSDKMKAQDLGLIDKKTGAGAKDLMKRAASVTLGKKLLVPVALGIGAVQYLKGKVNKKKEKNKNQAMRPITKKMGGGMMQRPMGMARYKKGTMIKARGGGIARSKPTKMY